MYKMKVCGKVSKESLYTILKVGREIGLVCLFICDATLFAFVTASLIHTFVLCLLSGVLVFSLSSSEREIRVGGGE